MNQTTYSNDNSTVGPPPAEETPPSQNYMLEFKTTTKNSKEYEYRTHKWNCQSQLNIDDYLIINDYFIC